MRIVQRSPTMFQRARNRAAQVIRRRVRTGVGHRASRLPKMPPWGRKTVILDATHGSGLWSGRGQASRRPGIQKPLTWLDSRVRGNDGKGVGMSVAQLSVSFPQPDTGASFASTVTGREQKR